MAPKQLVSLGGEGKLTSLERTAFESVSETEALDYLTIHIWIENWGWYDPERAEETFYPAMGRAMGYLADHVAVAERLRKPLVLEELDRKSTRLNSSHVAISYAVFCLKKK